MHHLLNLPPEILHIIIEHLDPATFYILLLASRKFQQFALGSRSTIIRQLNSLLGSRVRKDEQSTPELLRSFYERATNSFCAAGVLANVKLFIPTYNPSPPGFSRSKAFRKTNPSISKALGVGRPCNNNMSRAVFSLNPAGPPHLLARVDENEIINVYLLTDKGVSLIAQLWHLLPDAFERSDLTVRNIAFSANLDIAVLYGPGNKTLSPLLKNHQLAPLRLVTFTCVYGAARNITYSSSMQETRDILGFAEPVSLAIATNGHACISWDRCYGAPVELWFIGRNKTIMEKTKYREYRFLVFPSCSLEIFFY